MSDPSGGNSGPSPFSTHIPPRSLTPRNSWGPYQLLIWASGGEGWSPGLAGCAWAFGTYEQPLFNSGVSHQSTSLPCMHPLHLPSTHPAVSKPTARSPFLKRCCLLHCPQAWVQRERAWTEFRVVQTPPPTRCHMHPGLPRHTLTSTLAHLLVSQTGALILCLVPVPSNRHTLSSHREPLKSPSINTPRTNPLLSCPLTFQPGSSLPAPAQPAHSGLGQPEYTPRIPPRKSHSRLLQPFSCLGLAFRSLPGAGFPPLHPTPYFPRQCRSDVGCPTSRRCSEDYSPPPCVGKIFFKKPQRSPPRSLPWP